MASTREEGTALIREFLTTTVANGDTNGLSTSLSEGSVDRYPVLEKP